MRKKFSASTNVDDVALLAHTWALAPQAPAEDHVVVELAQRRMKVTRDTGHHPWSFYVLGLAYYHTGRYRDAVDLLQKRLTEDTLFEYNALNYLVLSLSLTRLERKAEARRWLEQARQAMKARDAERWVGLKRYAPPNVRWVDWWQLKALERQADALLREKPEPKETLAQARPS
jgi:tetratricopeptide (TPR) repeat protein